MSKILKFYKLNDAINSKIDGNNGFIISNEMMKRNKSIVRNYTVFSDFLLFLQKRYKYPHCHEILVNHVNAVPNNAGRLVFDFDIEYDDKLICIPAKFKKQVQHIILKVIDEYYVNIDVSKLIFVWSTSPNKTKLSKHLTVKNLCFSEWDVMSRAFYNFFCMLWDKKYTWIASDQLIDKQIIRKNGSLRMVGSSKINGNALKFDNTDHVLTDSLIRLYTTKDINNEQMVNSTNINVAAHEEYFNLMVALKEENNVDCPKEKPVKEYINTIVYSKEVYEKAYELCNELMKDVFSIRNIHGKRIDLLREKKHKCFLSENIHEHENAYLVILDSEFGYDVHFGCYRYCNRHEGKTCLIGKINFMSLKLNLETDTASESSDHYSFFRN